jgi:hypothetical protein
MADIISSVGSAASSTISSLKWVLYATPLILVVGWLGMWYREKKIFIYPVRIFKVRENGKVTEVNCKGGYVNRKNSAPFFRIKLGKWWWQHVDLTKTPNPEGMDEQNRVYYKQIDVDTYVQLRRTFSPGLVTLTPIEPDIKYGAILSIHRIKQILEGESGWKKIAPYIGLILMFMLAIIGWWFVMDSKCPSIG